MSNVKTWMPLYIGDYLADTGRLNTLQHGAYLLILMEIWRNGPIRLDHSELSTVAKMDEKTWKKSVWPSLERFFVVDADGAITQKRLTKERAKAEDISNKRRAAVQQRRDRSGNKEDTKEPTNVDTNRHTKDHTRALSRDNPQSSSLRSEDTLASLVPPNPHRDERQKRAEEFAEFWAAYPRHVGKDGAQRAHTKARTRATQAEIMDGLSRHIAVWPDRKSDRAQFIPYPATWLNNGGWQDDPRASAAASPVPAPTASRPQSALADQYDRLMANGGFTR